MSDKELKYQAMNKTYPVIFGSGYGWQMLWILPDLDLVVMSLLHIPEESAGSHSVVWDEVEKIILPAVVPH